MQQSPARHPSPVAASAAERELPIAVIRPKRVQRPRSMFRSLVIAYVAVGAIGVLASYAVLGRAPWVHPTPWLELPQLQAQLVSMAIGGVLGVLVISFSWLSVRWFRWARELSAELSVFARGLGPGEAAVVALLSGVAEEILFRGFVQPLLGLVLSALVFGVLHRGKRSGFAWTAWATALGGMLGALYALTGSIAGPIFAHVLINAVNVRVLQRTPLLVERPAR